MVRDGLVFKDEDGQVIFNQYSFCELVKHLLVELVGISYEEASQTVERSPLVAPVSNVMGVAVFSHDLPYYWAMFFYYGNGYWWEKGIPAQPDRGRAVHPPVGADLRAGVLSAEVSKRRLIACLLFAFNMSIRWVAPTVNRGRNHRTTVL